MSSRSASFASIKTRALPAVSIAAARELPLTTLVIVVVLLITGGAG
jgi:hypothetical protein